MNATKMVLRAVAPAAIQSEALSCAAIKGITAAIVEDYGRGLWQRTMPEDYARGLCQRTMRCSCSCAGDVCRRLTR